MTKKRQEKLEKGELIPLTCDFLFADVFNKEENIGVLEYFISFYLNIPYEETKGNLKINKRELPLDVKSQANRNVDLLLSYKRKKINIELSNSFVPGNIERNIVYLCGIHGRQLKNGDKNYLKIDESIQINFTNFRVNEREIRESYYLKNESGKVLSKKIKVDFVDIALAKEECYNCDTLAGWCRLLSARNERDLKLQMEELSMDEKTSDTLLKEVKRISEDDDYYELYTELSHREMLENTIKEQARIDGHEEGRKEGMKEVAKKMLLANEPIKKISEFTNLSLQEIEELKNQL